MYLFTTPYNGVSYSTLDVYVIQIIKFLVMSYGMLGTTLSSVYFFHKACSGCVQEYRDVYKILCSFYNGIFCHGQRNLMEILYKWEEE